MKPMACIVCRKSLESVWGDAHADEPLTHENQPYEATAFASMGHYGSTVFDPMDGTYIEINICDPCLTVAAESGLVMTGGAPPRTRDKTLRPWNPHEDDTAVAATDRK